MADISLDEDIPVAVAGILSAAGHPTRTTVALRRLGAWDADQLRYATERGWTVVTHNRRDYHALHEAWIIWSSRWQEPRPHSGILILDQGNRLTATDDAAAILVLLADKTIALANHTWDWFARGDGQWVQWRRRCT